MGFKKLSAAVFIAGAVLLSACQSQPSSTLRFTPPAPTTQFNAANQNAVLNVATRDARTQPEISSYVIDGNVFKLFAEPTVTQLFDQVIKQDLNAKGFRIAATPAQSNSNVLVDVTNFYAKVEQGNLRYKIDSSIQLNVQVQGAKGQFTKKIGGTRTQEGAFSAKNDEIQKVLNQTFSEVVQAIYRDQEIAAAINKFSH
ncbi:YajG family lipoprotein [Necropsobacter massiliensis]|uniref:YajG family lipoprotein n=1 Tax=Necropsobacter massiliensis TaxID=1400001 RepID=UPI000595B6B7|nr:YajG family lipoprotein [Necropsobacter massiliensis]